MHDLVPVATTPPPMHKIIVVKNPFDRRDQAAFSIPPVDGRTVAALVGEYIPAGVDVHASINGQIVPRESWASRSIVVGDLVVFVPRVQGGRNPLAIIAIIALAIAAPQLGVYFANLAELGYVAGAATAATAAYGAVIGAGISLVGGLVINSVFGIDTPRLAASDFDSSPSYGWTPVTTQQPGGPLARAYGRFKLHGNIIAGWIENQDESGSLQRAHMLIDLGMGPYSALTDHKINDQPINDYSGVTITERLGLLTQSVIPSFNDTRLSSTFSGAKVVLGAPVVRTTTGSDFTALEVILQVPSGLWFANDQGGLDPHQVQLKIEMQIGAGAYRNIASTTLTLTSTSIGYWSGGYWASVYNPNEGEGGSSNWVWTETDVGSSVRNAHTEGELVGGATPDGAGGPHWWRWLSQSITRTDTSQLGVILVGSSQKPIRRVVRATGIPVGSTCNIRVTNLSADLTANSRYGDAVYFTEITEVIPDDFTYPREVLVSIDALATDQLSGSIRYSCIAQGAKIWVKTGAVWTFEWSQDPAWVCFDILTQPVTNDAGTAILRYDGFNISRIDVDSFQIWSTFCNELVSDGAFGTEKRALFDGVFDTETDMWSAALEVAATARGTLVLHGTTIVAIYDDAKSTPTQMYTVANSKDFTETFLSLEGRSSIVEVEFMNLEADYERDKVSIVNSVVIAQSGISSPASRELRITRSSQAWREANVMLARNRYIRRTAELSVDIDSLASTVGDRIDVQSDIPQWGEGGRCGVGSTTTVIVLDHDVTIGAAYQILVRHSTGTDAIETRTISTTPGVWNTVTVPTPFSVAPAQFDVWALGPTLSAAKPFLITSITRDSDSRAHLSLVEYNASMYGLDDGIPARPTPNISASVGNGKILLTNPNPTNDGGSPVAEGPNPDDFLAIGANGTIVTMISAHWWFSDRNKTRRTHIRWNRLGGFPNHHITEGDSAILGPAEDGFDYFLSFQSENYLGQLTPIGITQIRYTPLGKLRPPSDVTVFNAVADQLGVNLTWSHVADIDRKDYGITEQATFVEPITYLDATSLRLPAQITGVHTFLIKARDTTGHLSVNATSASVVITPPATPQPGYTVVGGQIKLFWQDATTTHQVNYYEVLRGADFGTAVQVTCIDNLEFLLTPDWVGDETFWVVAEDIAGNLGNEGGTAVHVAIPEAVSVTAQTIDNNVLLFWTRAFSAFPIDTYEVRRGATWGAATVIGEKAGLFTSLFETQSGTYTYWIAGIDILGNVGVPAAVSATVAQPPDYFLFVDFDSVFAGTLSGAVSDGSGVVLPVNTTETFADHFINNSWTTPQDQVTAGFPIFIEPSAASGYYEETIDYGTTLDNTRITLTYDQIIEAGTPVVTVTLSTKLLIGDPWDDNVGVTSIFAVNFRYAKVKFVVTSAGGDDLIRIQTLNIRLDAKIKSESGMGTAAAGDTGGTTVTFTESFVDINSITVTPAGTTAIIAIYDFVDTPNPTDFKVLLFNTSGTRVSGDFSWQVKGY